MLIVGQMCLGGLNHDLGTCIRSAHTRLPFGVPHCQRLVVGFVNRKLVYRIDVPIEDLVRKCIISEILSSFDRLRLVGE